MNIFSPLFLPCILGFVITREVIKKTPVPHPTFFSLILSPALGLALTSVIVFWSYVLAGSHAKILSLLLMWIFSLAAMAWFCSSFRWSEKMLRAASFFKNLREFADSRKLKINDLKFLWYQAAVALAFLLFLAYLIAFLHYFTATSMYNIFGGWDARYYWNLKARILFRAPNQWTAIFDHELSPTDYPLMLPCATTWGWLVLNLEALAWPAIVAFVFTFSTVALVFWYLATSSSSWNAILGTTLLISVHAFQLWSRTQYADVPLIFLMTSAILSLVLAIRYLSPRLFFLTGLLAALAAWTKNGGCLFIVCATTIMMGCLLFDRKFKHVSKRKITLFYVLGLAFPLITLGCLKCFGQAATQLSIVATPLSLPANPSEMADLKNIFITIFMAFQDREQWGVFWVLFLIAVFYNLTVNLKFFLANYRWVFLFSFVFFLAGYILTIYRMPRTYMVHILVNSIFRIILQLLTFALLFLFESFKIDRNTFAELFKTPKATSYEPRKN